MSNAAHNAYDVIISPVITEKSTRASVNNQVVFKVRSTATKPQIKAAVEQLFSVKVKSVNTSVRKGKKKVFRGMVALQSDVKKAVVTLEAGHMIDVMTGLYASVAVLAALVHRERTGQGQHIDLALLDVQVATLANQAANYLIGGTAPKRMGNAHPNIVPYQDFPTADGYMIIAVGNDHQFRMLCETLGRPEWGSDERFVTNPQRVKYRSELIALIHSVTVTRTTDEWISQMGPAGVPCGPINTLDKVFADPQVQARGMRIDMAHPLGGNVPLVANPINMSESPVRYLRPPPTLGEHTEEVLNRWLGVGPSEFAELRANKII